MKINTRSLISQVSIIDLGKTFFNRFDSKNIEFRTEKFTQMLKKLTKAYSSYEDVDFLRWLEIDRYVILQHSPPKKNKPKAVSGSFSVISSFIDGEKTGELRNLLLDLESGANVSSHLKTMENYIMETKSAFSIQGICRFLLGDTESKGFLMFAFTKHDSCHYKCSLSLETLSRMLARATNPQASSFVRVLVGMSLSQLNKLDFSSHILNPGMKKCKQTALEILDRYLQENPQRKPAGLVSQRAAEVYLHWLASKQSVSGLGLRSIAAADFVLADEVKVEPSTQSLTWPGVFIHHTDINVDPKERAERFTKFKEASLKKQQQAGKLKAVFKELELINHDIIYLSVPFKRKDLNSSQSEMQETNRETHQWMVCHEPRTQLIHIVIVESDKEFTLALQYFKLPHPVRFRETYRLTTVPLEQHSGSNLKTFLSTERKRSNNLSLSTNCGDSETDTRLKSIFCQVEGEVALIRSKENTMERIDLTLLALTFPTVSFFTADKVLQSTLPDIVAEITKST